MAKNQTFNISLRLLSTQFKKGMKDVQKQLRGFGNFVKSAFAIGSITAFGRQMVNVGKDFEDAMSRVKAVSNATEKEFKAMQKEAQRLGATTRYSATEAANALENLTRNGLSASQATKALEATLQLAGANAIDLATAADICTNTMNAFGLQVKDLTRINDVLASTCASSATNINDLYEAMVVAGPYSKIMGKSLEETAAALGVLANNGIKGSAAGKAIAAMYQRLSSITPKAAKAMAKFGLDIDESTVKSQSLFETLQQLANSGIGESVEALSDIFGKNYAGSIAQLINNLDDFNDMLDTTTHSAGTVSRMFKDGVGSTKNAFDTLKSTYESFLISLSQKTSGVIKGVVNLLTNLINNFKTVHGTILNLASILVPFILKGIRNIQATYKAAGAKIIATSAAIKTAIGGWIDILITAVTWIGTALVASLGKYSKAVNEAKKEMKNTETEIVSMKGKVESLISTLSKNGKESLNGVVAAACELFPDFADAIKDAAKEAGKTGNYDELITKLRQINDLQARMMANSAANNLYQANLNMGGHMMRTASKSEKEKAGLTDLSDYFKKNNISKEIQEAIYGAILDMRIRGAKDSEINTYIQGATGGGASLRPTNQGGFNANMISGLPSLVGKGRDLLHSINDNNAALDAASAEAARIAQANADAAQAAADEEDAQNERDKNAQKKAEKIASVRTQLEDDIATAEDQLKNGFIDNKEYLQKLTNAYKKAYDDFFSLTKKGGDENPYFSGYKQSLQNQRAATPQLAPIAATLPPAQVTMPQKETLAMPKQPKPVNYNVGLEQTITEFDQINQISQSIVGNITNMVNAFDTLNDENASFTDKLQASLSIMQGVQSVLETVNMLTKVGTALTAAQTVVEGENATVKTVGAIASIFSGNGEIPVAGLAIAAAGVAALLAALACAPKFASGGIVGGASMHGDQNLARVNGGEMILNPLQQSRLFEALRSNNVPSGGQVEFIIQGKTLRGVLNNFDKSNSKIKGSL